MTNGVDELATPCAPRARSVSRRRAAPALAAAVAGLCALTSSVAFAETLRVTVDNTVVEVLVDGVPLTLGPNSGDWVVPDDYTLELSPGRHVIAIRGADIGGVAGMMAVVYADDGVTALGVTSPANVRTVRVDPGAGWGDLAFDDAAWPAAGACANPGAWGTSVSWGRSVGADMVWGPVSCDAADEINITRWFRFEVVVPCVAAECADDGNPCTAAACVAGACAQVPVAPGGSCVGGVCDGAGVCVECVDDSSCGAAQPFCDVTINTCVECLADAACDDGNPCTTDTCTLGACTFPTAPAGASCPGGVCLGTAPTCVACLGDSDCGGTTPLCDVDINTCVECLGAADCNDGIACTLDTCALGACAFPTAPAGASCPGGVCLGTAPTCVACLADADCTGATPLCDAAINTCVECLDASSCDDSNACTADTCDAGACASTPLASGLGCPGGVCDGSGACVECVSDAQCEGARCDVGAGACVECLSATDCDDSDPCTVDSCAAGSCARAPAMAGTPCADGVCAGDTTACVTCVADAQCAAPTPWCVARDCVACRDGDDCDDGNECTTNGCDAGTCTSTPRAPGSTCATGICTPAAACAVVEVEILVPDDGARTASTTPVISGTATPGVTVSVTVDGEVVGSATAEADGTWSVVVTTALEDGARVATASVTTAAGDATDMSTFIVDTVTEVAISSPADGSTIDDWTPNIRGTGEPGATIVVTLDGAELGTTTVSEDGTWLVAVEDTLADGTYTAAVTSTDVVGNTATDSSTFTVEAGTEVEISSPENGSVTNDATPTITGTALPGATVVVTIEVDGVSRELGTVTVDDEGLWSIEVDEALPEGSHSVTARATDPAGNTASDESVFTVDLTTTVSIVDVDPSGFVTGTGEAGATVVVTVDGVELGSATVGEDGTWRVEGDALEPGEREVTATITDEAGNTESDTTTITVPAPDVDAGVPDAGPSDAGPSDAGIVIDGGTPEADAGITDGRHSGGGCSCRTSSDAGSPLALIALVGFMLARRRRSQR